MRWSTHMTALPWSWPASLSSHPPPFPFPSRGFFAPGHCATGSIAVPPAGGAWLFLWTAALYILPVRNLQTKAAGPCLVRCRLCGGKTGTGRTDGMSRERGGFLSAPDADLYTAPCPEPPPPKTGQSSPCLALPSGKTRTNASLPRLSSPTRPRLMYSLTAAPAPGKPQARARPARFRREAAGRSCRRRC